MDKGKRDKVKVGVKTINQLLERRKEMKRYSSILMVLLLILAFGLTQGCSKGSSPTEPSSGGTVADTGSGSGSGSSSGSDSGSGSGSDSGSDNPQPPMPQFAVTDVSISVSRPVSILLNCPRDVVYTLTGTITVNAPGTVSYYWVTSGGDIFDLSLTFDSAGSKTVTLITPPITITESETLVFQIATLQPNVDSDVKTIQETCRFAQI